MRKPKGKRISEKQWAGWVETWDVLTPQDPPNRRDIEKKYRRAISYDRLLMKQNAKT